MITEERIIAYLLKELPDDDLEQFDQECFAHESWPTQIDLIEDDLIDAYLRGELTQERQQRFERNYLTTLARKERVIMAAALLRHVDERNRTSEIAGATASTKPTWAERFSAFWRSQSWALRAGAAVAIVAVIGGALWLSSLSSPSSRTVAMLNLTIGSGNRAEGAESGKITLTPDVEALQISLTLPHQSLPGAHYRVELENDNGERQAVEIIEKNAQSVIVVVPAAKLSREQYALKLFVIQPDGVEQRIPGSYFFDVE
jgi:hypothetical protein